jgi:plastocyanin
MKKTLALLIAVTALAAMFAGSPPASAGGGCHDKTRMPFSDDITAQIAATECTYQPIVARVDAGQEVTFHNKDGIPHTFTGVQDSWGDYKEYEQGESVTHTFDKPGVYPYFCKLHPGMAAAIVVGDGDAAASAAGDTSAVSAVSVGQPDAPERDAAALEEEGEGRSPGGIAAALAALVAILGGVAAAPLVIRRLRNRA